MPDAPTASEALPEAHASRIPDTVDLTEREPTVTVQNGRRRGKRRVMKMKKVKDEDGYLGKQDSGTKNLFANSS